MPGKNFKFKSSDFSGDSDISKISRFKSEEVSWAFGGFCGTHTSQEFLDPNPRILTFLDLYPRVFSSVSNILKISRFKSAGFSLGFHGGQAF